MNLRINVTFLKYCWRMGKIGGTDKQTQLYAC